MIKKIGITIAIIFVLVILSCGIGFIKNILSITPTPISTPISTTPTTKTTSTSTVTPKLTSKLTLSQKNAIKAAKNYIENMPFSKKGLIKQLKFEGYSEKEAKFAVESIKIDYKEQAYKTAENYIDNMAFSRDALFGQLKFEGFTTVESNYALNKVGL